jgi:hypothetical protein
MNGNSRKLWRLLAIALFLMIGGSALGSWINTGAGAATVSEVKIFAPNGYVISAYLRGPPRTVNPGSRAGLQSEGLMASRAGFARVVTRCFLTEDRIRGWNCDQAAALRTP